MSLLALVNARDHDQQVNRGAVKETLIDVPADELKQMILSLLQDGGDDQMPLDMAAEEEVE